jgi:hypothetical protein
MCAFRRVRFLGVRFWRPWDRCCFSALRYSASSFTWLKFRSKFRYTHFQGSPTFASEQQKCLLLRSIFNRAFKYRIAAEFGRSCHRRRSSPSQSIFYACANHTHKKLWLDWASPLLWILFSTPHHDWFFPLALLGFLSRLPILWVPHDGVEGAPSLYI